MAAIPDAGGARCAPRGVIRALLRVAVFGGLVIAGWLLGSGIGQAQECPVHEYLGPQDNSLVRLVEIPPPDEGSGGLRGTPPTVRSTVAGVLRAVPVPRLPVRPAQVPALAPLLDPVSQLAAPAPVTLWRPAAHQPAVVPPQPAASPAPAVRAAPATATVLRPVDDGPAATPVYAAAHPVADPLADQVAWPSALGGSPAAPAPASPPGTTTAPCPGGNAGGGTTTQSVPSVTFSDRWAADGLASTHCRLGAGASGIPRSAAQRPSTSPD